MPVYRQLLTDAPATSIKAAVAMVPPKLSINDESGCKGFLCSRRGLAFGIRSGSKCGFVFMVAIKP